MSEVNLQFDPSRVGILFFSRGRGRGHAIPDMAIAEKLLRLRDDADIRFVSYATGAATFTEFGHSVIESAVIQYGRVDIEIILLAGDVVFRTVTWCGVNQPSAGAIVVLVAVRVVARGVNARRIRGAAISCALLICPILVTAATWGFIADAKGCIYSPLETLTPEALELARGLDWRDLLDRYVAAIWVYVIAYKTPLT